VQLYILGLTPMPPPSFSTMRKCEMVWPITGAEFYVWEAGKSMKARELAASRKDSWRKIAIALIDPDRPILNECYRN
jgi:hypothetical protein